MTSIAEGPNAARSRTRFARPSTSNEPRCGLGTASHCCVSGGVERANRERRHPRADPGGAEREFRRTEKATVDPALVLLSSCSVLSAPLSVHLGKVKERTHAIPKSRAAGWTRIRRAGRRHAERAWLRRQGSAPGLLDETHGTHVLPAVPPSSPSTASPSAGAFPAALPVQGGAQHSAVDRHTRVSQRQGSS